LGKKDLRHYEDLRLNVLSSMVSSVLITGRSELNQMALGNPERKQYSSKVKQYKRLVQNKHIDCKTYYEPYIRPLLLTLSLKGLLVFSIDGSVVGQGCMCLMFSVIHKGKAIPVVWKVYKAKKGHLAESTHQDLLKSLSKLVPATCRVVITGDGEFDGCDWQQDILNQGWDYVLRTGKNIQITEDNWDIFRLGSICILAGSELFLEQIGFTKKDFPANIFVWYGIAYKEPLFLVTNLDYGQEIKQFYNQRFKIEPFFEKLLIATCLAYILAIMCGVKALKSKLRKEIDRTDGEFLSLFQLGYRFMMHLVDLRQWRTFSWQHDFTFD